MYRLIYCQEYNRVFPAVYIDSQYTIPDIANKLGVEIKAFTDAKVREIATNENQIPYKIETEKGILVGIVSIVVDGGVASIGQFQVRPPHIQNLSDIRQEILNFIASGNWQDDILT